MSQPTITIYTTPTCPFCVRAKALLDQKGASFDEIDVARDPSIREAMMRRANGRRSVPQIFIGDLHVGGSDDLYDLERAGKLDSLLNGKNA
ncbi:glutaredoxin 3 [Paracoccus fistulariae]|uniref:Glutaredoxin n=1 Tax=Paracoccus fistulariae TaxID=658446 RepID=A0ABY7SI20_9RHOB|nr:glutaredoxin 3 [Paracoccus fistulariae]MDB6182107.1 glutaredoxin 3 [Paracoccus fistulariae]WCR06665.1 glutaredoxin 3 [Paracoccus fistulariae]